MLEYLSRLKNLRQSIAQLNPRQKLLTVALLFVVILTWLAVCALLVSLFI